MSRERAARAARVERAGALIGSEYVRTLQGLAPGAEAACAWVAGGALVFAGRQHPMSRAVGLGLAGPVSAEELDEIEAFYLARQAPVLLDLCPYAHRTLHELVSGRRYAISELENVWGMGGHLEAPGPPLPEPEGVTVQTVGEDEADAWTRTVLGGAFEPADISGLDLDVFRPFPRMRTVSCFLALVDGRPAGGGCLAIAAGTAALFTTSTLPEFRGRGVQTALLRARLAAAAAGGCDLAFAVTQPASVSERNVERLGFQVLYTRAVAGRGW